MSKDPGVSLKKMPRTKDETNWALKRILTTFRRMLGKATHRFEKWKISTDSFPLFCLFYDNHTLVYSNTWRSQVLLCRKIYLINAEGMTEYQNFAIPNWIINLFNEHQWLLSSLGADGEPGWGWQPLNPTINASITKTRPDVMSSCCDTRGSYVAPLGKRSCPKQYWIPFKPPGANAQFTRECRG